MRTRLIVAITGILVLPIVSPSAAEAAPRAFANCAAFNATYPAGIARSEGEALAAVGRRMARPPVNRKVYAAARKANPRMGSPADGVLCEVPLPVTVPGAPRDIITPLGATQAVYLQWSPPDSDGNATITSYLVRGPGAITVNGTQATIAGLQPDTEYTFQIIAVNSAGEGPAATFTTRTNPNPAPTPTPAAPPTSSATRYKNCDAARAAGVTPIRRGTAIYDANRHLDRDGDGIACE